MNLWLPNCRCRGMKLKNIIKQKLILIRQLKKYSYFTLERKSMDLCRVVKLSLRYFIPLTSCFNAITYKVYFISTLVFTGRSNLKQLVTFFPSYIIFIQFLLFGPTFFDLNQRLPRRVTSASQATATAAAVSKNCKKCIKLFYNIK